MKITITCILLLTSIMTIGQNKTAQDYWKLYQSQKYDLIVEQLTPQLNERPNDVELNLILGRSQADLGNYSKAIPYLENSIEHDNKNNWEKAWALGYIGNCLFMIEEYEKSKKALSDCISLNITKNATKYAYGRMLLFGFDSFYDGWKVYESDNFRFHFQNMSDSDAKKYVQSHENTYQGINSFFKSEIPKKIDFFVWNLKEDAKKLMNQNLGFAKPYFSIVHSHYQQTLGHEMTHVISHYATEIKQKTGLINEGTSVCFDQATQDKEQIVKDWISTNGKKIDIHKIWESWTDYPMELTYPLSGLFVKELIDNFGRDKFIECFGNQTYENAKKVLGENLDKVILDFENNINT
ncbi:tetratricopeptide repeat protein [Carboxylicivirga marina]|uniref:Tetratricopeptide repeat protein n=1 Tax=Carboxylicivirga marina TaxID=2800988 RepID=A0ABS1HQ42_9BACT|nr:hypothetical protein [Carboxylicivirga marina]MBK3519798.1 hypothetical protein [Carboxylicivirga marina]